MSAHYKLVLNSISKTTHLYIFLLTLCLYSCHTVCLPVLALSKTKFFLISQLVGEIKLNSQTLKFSTPALTAGLIKNKTLQRNSSQFDTDSENPEIDYFQCNEGPTPMGASWVLLWCDSQVMLHRGPS